MGGGCLIFCGKRDQSYYETETIGTFPYLLVGQSQFLHRTTVKKQRNWRKLSKKNTFLRVAEFKFDVESNLDIYLDNDSQIEVLFGCLEGDEGTDK